MRGTISARKNNSYLVNGDDGKHYHFSLLEWPLFFNPKIGMKIEFVPNEGAIKDISQIKSADSLPEADASLPEADTSLPGTHTRGILALVCWFLGCFGAHRFMTGNIGSGIAMIALTFSTILAVAAPIFILGIIAAGIWAFIDFVLILSGEFRASNGAPIKKWWPD